MTDCTVKRRNRIKRDLIKTLIGVLYASPVIIGVLLFTYYPAAESLYYAFTDYDFFHAANWVGFRNFVILFTIDPETWKVLGNTFLYAAVSIPINMLLGYFLALAANFKVKGISIFRTLFYLPVIIPSVASGLLYLDMFEAGRTGIINAMLESINLPRLTWFSQANTSMATFIFMGVWHVGGSMIIWLSCFKNIPEELYEGAKLDGASAFVRLVKITIPMSTPIIFYNLVTGIIGSLQVNSSLIIGGSEGRGVGDSLYFIAIKIYNTAFGSSYDMGYASAMAWILFSIIAVLTALTFKSSKWVFYGEE